MMSKLLQTYYRAVQKRPILVQCCMTSSMWMIGDSLAQYLERQNTTNKSKGPKTHNYSRTLKMGLIGLCWNGPFSAWWLRFLDRKLGTATNSATVYKKLFFDQVCQNPVLTGGIIFLVGLSNNLSVEKSATVVQDTGGLTLFRHLENGDQNKLACKMQFLRT